MIALAMLLAAAAPQPASGGATRARPLEPLANWISDRDYPVDAIRREASGVTHFRLVIDERGNVESCTVTESSNDASLDAATCSIMSIRGHYEPARDDQGRPVRDTIESRIRWVLPDERPPRLPFEPVRFVTSLHVAADGAVTCSTNTSPDPDDSMSRECGMFKGWGVERTMRAAHADTTLTNIFTIVPAGAPAPPAGTTDYGRLIVDADAVLSIASDGKVADCRVAAERTSVPSNLCSVYSSGEAVFEPLRGPGGPRIVNLSMKIYLRGAVPGLFP